VKYELLKTDTVINFFGEKMFRIRALVEFGGVEIGELGGYIESEKNLDQSGSAWVYGDARVYGSAWVSGSARVSGDAEVSGSAWVYGSARVSGDAWVYGSARVSGSAWVYGSARVSGDAWVSLKFKFLYQIRGSSFFVTIQDSMIQIGCLLKSKSEWLKTYIEEGKKNGFTDEQIEEYRKYIDLAKDEKAGVK